jgi:hypothetical protein
MYKYLSQQSKPPTKPFKREISKKVSLSQEKRKKGKKKKNIQNPKPIFENSENGNNVSGSSGLEHGDSSAALNLVDSGGR